MPYIANPNAGPQTSWSSNDPLTNCLTNSATWAEYLKAYLENLANYTTAPAIEEWSLPGEVLLGQSPNHGGPNLPSATTVTGPADNTLLPFDFTDTPFVPGLKTAAQTVIADVLAGNSLLSQDTWDDLYTDAADDITVAYAMAATQAGNLSGMLGELPGEALIVLAERATTEQRKALQKARLTLATEQAKVRREDMTRAVEAARMHDQAFGAIHNQEQERSLKVALAGPEMSYKVYSAGWQGVQTKYAARLAAMQADAIPAELQVKAESNLIAFDGKTNDNLIENAKLEQNKGVTQANLYLKQLEYTKTINTEILKAMASLSAHTMGSFLSAGSVHYSASLSESYSNSNSYSMTKDETT